MKQTRSFIAVTLLLVSLPASATPLPRGTDTYDNIELMQANGDHLRETSVRVVFDETAMRVISRSNGAVMKEWSYDKIKSAEYSYTKNPRWKTGIGLGVASVLFPPAALGNHDFAVLKVGKGVRKVFMPAFETRTSVQIKALGDDK
ncbi:MAG: hypothetical protein ABJB34_08210 [Acidobacteriota bacterium]